MDPEESRERCKRREGIAVDFKRTGDQHFRKNGRLTEITIDLVLQSPSRNVVKQGQRTRRWWVETSKRDDRVKRKITSSQNNFRNVSW